VGVVRRLPGFLVGILQTAYTILFGLVKGLRSGNLVRVALADFSARQLVVVGGCQLVNMAVNLKIVAALSGDDCLVLTHSNDFLAESQRCHDRREEHDDK